MTQVGLHEESLDDCFVDRDELAHVERVELVESDLADVFVDLVENVVEVLVAEEF